MEIIKGLNIIIIAVLLISCSKEENNVKYTPIEVKSISDEVHANSFFEMDTFLRLSNTALLGRIEKIIISDSLIYVLDNIPKLVCFDSSGRVKFNINKTGKGPDEFLKLIDFSVDPIHKSLVLLDERQMKVLFFNSENGKFIKNAGIKFYPNNIKMVQDELYFYNPYTNVRDNKYHYSLIMTSLDNSNIERKWIKHDDINRLYFTFTKHHFFTGDEGTYFINRMDNKIYELSENNLKLKYQISGLDFFDMSNIDKSKKNIEVFDDIKKSDKFYSIQNFSECSDYIYFTVHKKNRAYVVLYNKLKKEVEFCSSMLLTKPTKELPLFTSDLMGIKNGKLFGIIEPITIIGMKNHPKTPKLEIFSNSWSDLKVTDNPILVFYSVKNEKIK
ncbi:6-bladed beta-propeller [Saccharicrinis sp. FJH2]|uniref:6-bladed beta-propeller n=1 Tax=Saccharicrinis sp. FJH65 TaxID=3344659 RepID=UPI0035F34D0D